MAQVLPKTNRGQALIELIVVTPVVIALISGLLFSLYFLMAILWTDHWVYRANMCMIKGQTPWLCQKNLSGKIQILVPQNYFRVDSFWQTPRESRVQLVLDFPIAKKSITSSIPLPLGFP